MPANLLAKDYIFDIPLSLTLPFLFLGILSRIQGMQEQLLVNLGRAVPQTMGGRDYLVAPLTLIVPGVLNGSQGPIFYPPDEVERWPGLWNHVPLVVYHPVENGQHVTARHPDILDKSGVGIVLRDKYDEGKRSAEAWFEVEATKRVDKTLSPASRILPRLLSGAPIEISTGLDLDKEPAPSGAAHNGQGYDSVARNFRPDHLAILPDAKGACSNKDGCGINVNTEIEPLSTDEIFELNLALNERMCWGKPCGGGSGGGSKSKSKSGGKSKVGKKKEPWDIPGPGEKGHSKTPGTKTKKEPWDLPGPGEKGHSSTLRPPKPLSKKVAKSNLKILLKTAKDKRGGTKIPTAKLAPKIPTAKLAPKIPTATRAPAKSGGGFFSKIKKFFTGNQSFLGGSDMNRSQMIQHLTTNCDCWKGKGDKETLEQFDDKKLAALVGNSKIVLVVNQIKNKKGRNAEGDDEAVAGVPWTELAQLLGVDLDPAADPIAFASALKTKVDEISSKLGPAPAEDVPMEDTGVAMASADDEEEEEKVAMAAGTQEVEKTTNRRKPQTSADWLRGAPPEVRSAVTNAMNLEKMTKAKLVQQLVGPIANAAKRQAMGVKLMAKPLDELQELVSLIPEAQVQNQEIPNFAFAGGAGAGDGITNSGEKDDSDNILPVFSVDFEEMASPKLRRQQTA